MPPQSPRFWQENGLPAKALLPAAWLYQLGYRLRRKLTSPARHRIRLLCIGNLVAGGAGKTPVSLAIGAYLQEQSIRACFLSKGYGGSLKAPTLVDTARHHAGQTGDEALLLAQCLPTIIAANRRDGLALAEQQGFALAIMDDGFQNPTLAPDISLVVVDAAYGFGNGHTLPAGPLREPIAYGLSRADAVVLVDRGGTPAPLPDFTLPVLQAALQTHLPETVAPEGAWLAFSGIARPQAFFNALEQQCGLRLAARHPFPDHHPFTAAELQRLQGEAQRLDARLITTAKDAVRLPVAFRREVIVAQAAIKWHNAAALHTLLSPLEPR